MREPRQLLRELGPAGFAAFQLIVGGNVLAALVHPLFLATFIYRVISGAPMWHGGGTASSLSVTFYGTALVTGYGTSILLAWYGLARRGLLSTAWVLLLTPLHWLLLSLAAWRALAQFIVSPYRWEKTEHGLARSSRLAERAARSLRTLERYLSGIEAAGAVTLVPAQMPRTTYISAARRPLPEASA
jgi:hypothetical protein